jgi:hypothetical protein
MKRILDMGNQSVKDALKKCQDTKNIDHEKTQVQIKEHRKTKTKTKNQTPK